MMDLWKAFVVDLFGDEGFGYVGVSVGREGRTRRLTNRRALV
jgi:hypothetical protein